MIHSAPSPIETCDDASAVLPVRAPPRSQGQLGGKQNVAWLRLILLHSALSIMIHIGRSIAAAFVCERAGSECERDRQRTGSE